MRAPSHAVDVTAVRIPASTASVVARKRKVPPPERAPVRRLPRAAAGTSMSRTSRVPLLGDDTPDVPPAPHVAFHLSQSVTQPIQEAETCAHPIYPGRPGVELRLAFLGSNRRDRQGSGARAGVRRGTVPRCAVVVGGSPLPLA